MRLPENQAAILGIKSYKETSDLVNNKTVLQLQMKLPSSITLSTIFLRFLFTYKYQLQEQLHKVMLGLVRGA